MNSRQVSTTFRITCNSPSPRVTAVQRRPIRTAPRHRPRQTRRTRHRRRLRPTARRRRHRTERSQPPRPTDRRPSFKICHRHRPARSQPARAQRIHQIRSKANNRSASRIRSSGPHRRAIRRRRSRICRTPPIFKDLRFRPQRPARPPERPRLAPRPRRHIIPTTRRVGRRGRIC